MKSILHIVMFSGLLLTTSAQAKESIPVVNKLPKATFGVKAGANFEQLNGNSFEKAYKPGVIFGVFGGVHKNHLGIKAEVLVNTSQYSIKDSLEKGTFKAVTLAIPILVEYRVIPRLWLQAGPQFNSIMSVKSNNDFYQNPKQYFNTSNVNLCVGVEARLPVHFVAGARYVLGLTDLNKNPVAGTSDAWKTRTIQLYLGFRFI